MAHDVMAKVGVVLRNVEVLEGAPQPELKDRVVVERRRRGRRTLAARADRTEEPGACRTC
jgi:hypothetical protein